MKCIKTYKQLFEDNSEAVEIISYDYYMTDFNKSNHKVISEEYVDNIINKFNEAFPGSSVTLVRNDQSLWENNVYHIHDEDGNNSLCILRTYDDMLLIDYCLITYNNEYNRLYRMDYYSTDEVFDYLIDDMYNFYYDNFYLGVNDGGDFEDLYEKRVVKCIKTYKHFLESVNSFKVISNDFYNVECENDNKKNLSDEFLNNFKNILSEKFDKLDADIFFEDDYTIDDKYINVYNIIDYNDTNFFSIFRTPDDMILVRYEMVIVRDTLEFFYTVDYYDKNGLDYVVDNMIEMFNKHIDDF